VDALWATKSDGAGLIAHAISFQDFQPSLHVCGPDPPTWQRHGQIDGQTDGQMGADDYDMQSQ